MNPELQINIQDLIKQTMADHRNLMARLRAIAGFNGDLPFEVLRPALEELDRIYNDGTTVYGRVEHSVAYAEDLGYLERSMKNRVYVGDVAEVLRNISDFYIEIHRVSIRFKVPNIQESYPTGDTYGGMQSVIKMFRPEWVSELRQLMINANIPTMGFDEELSPVKTHISNSGINIQNSVVAGSVINDSFNAIQARNAEKSQPIWKIWYLKLMEMPVTLFTGVLLAMLLGYLGIKK